MFTVSARTLARATCAVAVAALCPAWSFAQQDVRVPALKAAFLANFAKFAEWPADARPAAQPFTFCVIGDAAVATALEEAARAHQGPDAVTVVSPAVDAPLQGCQLLYVGGGAAKHAMRILDAVRGAPVFTVSDGSRFAESGGIAQFVVEDGRMRFAINAAAAQRGRIGLSAKLLTLAILVKDGGDARR
jgi:hypothetical protein